MTEHQLELLYLKAGGAGWGPIDSLVDLSAHLFESRLTVVQDRGEVAAARKLSALFPRRRRSGHPLLVVAANPALLAYVAQGRHWFPGYEQIAAWVIDSFWTDRVARFATVGRHFDHFFVTDKQLVGEWQRLTRTPTSWLPWGTDTLAIERGRLRQDRSVDVQRIGRQPEAWDDDNQLQSLAATQGLVFNGRPPMGRTSAENQAIVRDSMLGSKFVLAFHNLVSPGAYTHPTRSYVTARWTDALAAGCTVVGAAPGNAADILWPEATIEIDPTDPAASLRKLAVHAEAWSPNLALAQAERARRGLDWRLRLRDLCQVLGWNEPSGLVQELNDVLETGGD